LSFLLDTHVFLWFESDSPRLSKRANALISDTQETVFISAVSFWEIAIKRRGGKLAYEGSPRAAARSAGFVELPIDALDAEIAVSLDWDHRDPFDRVLVAHCLNRSLTLVTADAALRSRGDIAVFWASGQT
jgi:PIN domain nuclease of toxin-antitoxin system